MIREEEKRDHTSSSLSTMLSSQVMNDLRSYHTHHTASTVSTHHTASTASTLQDSSIGAFSSDSHSTEISDATAEPDLRLRVIGRVDYERCICDLLPKLSKSQCVTEASRLFEKFAKERHVSKTVDGPCCNLLVLDHEGFFQSLSILAKKDDGELTESELKGRIIAEAKYNLQLVQSIVEYDEVSVASSIFSLCCKHPNWVLHEQKDPFSSFTLRRIHSTALLFLAFPTENTSCRMSE